MKRLLLTFSLCLVLSSCADRVRYNCDDLKTPNGFTEGKCQ
jgi:hypothetical protein